jgi:hypothetical protein
MLTYGTGMFRIWRKLKSMVYEKWRKIKTMVNEKWRNITK